MSSNRIFLFLCIAIAGVFVLLAFLPRHDGSTASPMTRTAENGRSSTLEAEVAPSSTGALEIIRDGGGAFTLSDAERVEVPDGPIDEVVGRLTPLANAGDVRASLALYRKMDQCFEVMRGGPSAQELAMYQAMGASEQYEAQITAAQKDCSTDGSVDLSKRGEYLERAAEGGSLEARLIFATDTSAFFSSPSQMISDPQALADYKRKSVRYMSELANQGNVDSMLWIARSYESGTMLDRDLANSYAYYRAVELSSPGIIPTGMTNNLKALLPAGDQRRGEELARSLHRRCCS